MEIFETEQGISGPATDRIKMSTSDRSGELENELLPALTCPNALAEPLARSEPYGMMILLTLLLLLPHPGRTANVDPEEAFVVSLSSCYMLTFLAIACK
jgi:hypothetical protein